MFFLKISSTYKYIKLNKKNKKIQLKDNKLVYKSSTVLSNLFLLKNLINIENKSYYNFEFLFRITNSNYIKSILLLKSSLNENYFKVDTTTSNNSYIDTYASFNTNEKITLTFSVNNFPIISTSQIFLNSLWLEKEIKEFNNIHYINLLDSRRLLTDYFTNFKVNNNNYKTDGYDIITQNLYMWMLHYIFIFYFLILISLFSFLFNNKSLLNIILISELIIILISLILSIFTIYFNIYYFVGLSIIVLILGGLELSLNLLMLIFKC